LVELLALEARVVNGLAEPVVMAPDAAQLSFELAQAHSPGCFG